MYAPWGDVMLVEKSDYTLYMAFVVLVFCLYTITYYNCYKKGSLLFRVVIKNNSEKC